jgi:cytochrome c oxidase assembly factor CtaG
MRLTRVALATAALAAPISAAAHPDSAGDLLARAPVWLAQALYASAWIAYAAGAVRVRPPPARALTLHAAMLVAGVALFGPFDAWAASSTAMHMVQHMLLIAVVAPLAALAAPLPQWRALLGATLDPWWRALLRCSRYPLACAALHAAAVWFWHAPRPYMLAALDPGWHVIEHACFLFSAWLFWWSVLRAGRRAALQALLALLVTLMHTGLLGALLTFARAPLYAAESRELWDQQVAGLVMWIPGSAVYLAGAAWLLWRVAPRHENAAGTSLADYERPP